MSLPPIHVGYFMKQIHVVLETTCNRELARYGITLPQMDILFYLTFRERENGEIHQKDIEEFFNLSNPTVSGLIHRLEQKALVRRKASELDGRCWSIVLTEKGRELGGWAIHHRDAMEDTMLAGFSTDEQVLLKNFLDRILKNVTA